jgi:hypothetical protein
MHRPDDESTCGLEIPIGPILVSLVDRFTETGNFEMVELVLEYFNDGAVDRFQVFGSMRARQASKHRSNSLQYQRN